MLFQLKTGQVEGYDEGQHPLIYLVSTAQAVKSAGGAFVFTDGHAYAAYSTWYNDLEKLPEVDWEAVRAWYWGKQNDSTGELQRKKQAEFLVHRFLPWELIQEVAVIDDTSKKQVAAVLEEYVSATPVVVRRAWYY